MKKIINTINFGILPGYALVSIGGTTKEVLEKEKDKQWKFYLQTLVDSGLEINFCNRTEIDGVTYFSLFIENKKNENWYSVLAHELLHMCQFLCNQHCVDMIQEKEMVAYLHTHLMNQIIDLNKKITK